MKPEPTNKPEALNLDDIFNAVFKGVNQCYHFPELKQQVFLCMKEAAELYARSKCREQREICATKAKVKTEIVKHAPDPCSYKVQVVDRESILNAPAPQFKP